MSDLRDLKEMTKAKAAQEMQELKDKIIERLSSIKRDGIDELIKYLAERTDYFTGNPARNTRLWTGSRLLLCPDECSCRKRNPV